MATRDLASLTPHKDVTEACSVTFWGVRGSAPASGADHLVFGGSTMCLEINSGDRRLILDAGSGIREFGRNLKAGDVREIDILLTHYHLDHILGLAAFAPLFQKGVCVTIYAPILKDEHPEAIITRFLREPFFPAPARDNAASLNIRAFHPGDELLVSGFRIGTTRLSHPGGACGYRICDMDRSVAVITDHEHAAELPDPSLVDFCKGTDLILYDAHWDEGLDYEAHRGWGHSTWQAGLRLAQAAGVPRLGCIHHGPDSKDDLLLEREGRLRQIQPASFFAREHATALV